MKSVWSILSRRQQSERIYKVLNPNGDPFRYDPEKNKTLEIIGLVLWATEGDRTQLSLANGNPAIVKKYLQFLREICNLNEEKIKVVLHCHDTLPYDRCLQFWSRITRVLPSRFKKPFIKKDSGGRRKYPYGICRITASNKKLVDKFKQRLEELGMPRDCSYE
jgi:hypothetical protein